MKSILIHFTVLFSIISNNPLIGRWESVPSEKGNVTGIVFKAGNVFEAYVNKKPFASGIYNFNATDSVFSFSDNGCDGQSATYKLMLYSNSDSLRFELLNDGCEPRRNGMRKMIMGRVKK